MMRKLLMLLCAIPVLGYGQFVENFDAGAEIPAGWTVINDGSAGTWQIINFTGAPITAHSGLNTAAIVYDEDLAHSDYLITPAVTVTAGVSDYLSFYGRSRDPLFPETISVLISTTGTDADDFTTVLDSEVAPTSTPDFDHYGYELTDYVGQTIYIAFYSETFNMFVFDVDDVSVGAIPSCFAPTALTASNESTTTIDLAWTSADANFEVEYGPAGFTQGTGTTIEVEGTSVSLSDLDSGSNYAYYVRTVCGEEDMSTWSGPFAFTTVCDVVATFPYMEGFDSEEFTCWTTESDSEEWGWEIANTNQNGTITPRTGSGMAQYYGEIQGGVATLISPTFDLTAVTAPQLTFYYANVNWVGDIDELRVYYRTSPAGDWTQIGDDFVEEMTSWTEVVLDLPNPSATYQIAFEGTSMWARGMDIDDVMIAAAPNCPAPTSVGSSNATMTTVDLGWTSTAENFEVEYGALGFTQGTGTTVEVEGTSTTLTDLAGSTNYAYYVRAVCSEEEASTWAGPFTFTTLCAPVVTSFPYTEGFEGDAFTCWTAQTESADWNWEIADSNQNGSITPRTGNGMAHYFSEEPGETATLISPVFDLTDVAGPQLRFFYANVNWFGDIDALRVYYRTSDAGAWTQIGDDYVEEMTEWTEVVLDLPNPSATYQIAFEGTTAWARGLDIDDVSVYASLAIGDNTTTSFRFYPNPVNDVLNLVNADTISKVEVYNLLGQIVMTQNVNAAETQINVSSLAAGAYMVKAFAGNQSQTIKIVKQ